MFELGDGHDVFQYRPRYSGWWHSFISTDHNCKFVLNLLLDWQLPMQRFPKWLRWTAEWCIAHHSYMCFRDALKADEFFLWFRIAVHYNSRVEKPQSSTQEWWQCLYRKAVKRETTASARSIVRDAGKKFQNWVPICRVPVISASVFGRVIDCFQGVIWWLHQSSPTRCWYRGRMTDRWICTTAYHLHTGYRVHWLKLWGDWLVTGDWLKIENGAQAVSSL